MIPQLIIYIQSPLTISPWWLTLPVLLLIAVAIQVWLLFETRRMKSKIERLLDLTSTTDGQDNAPTGMEQSLDDGDGDPKTEPLASDTVSAMEGADDIWQSGKKISKMDRELLARIDAEIEANIQDSEYTIETLRAKLGISRSGLYKKLIFLTGRAPLEYIRIKRLQMGRAMLESGETSVSQIAWSVGFSPKQFSKYFKDEYGCLPSEYIHYLSN